jgi:hypothetical protein
MKSYTDMIFLSTLSSDQATAPTVYVGNGGYDPRRVPSYPQTYPHERLDLRGPCWTWLEQTTGDFREAPNSPWPLVALGSS